MSCLHDAATFITTLILAVSNVIHLPCFIFIACTATNLREPRPAQTIAYGEDLLGSVVNCLFFLFFRGGGGSEPLSYDKFQPVMKLWNGGAIDSQEKCGKRRRERKWIMRKMDDKMYKHSMTSQVSDVCTDMLIFMHFFDENTSVS